MPSLLSLDWNRDALGCVEADVTGGQVRVLRIGRFDWPAAIDRDTDAPTLGDWLKQQLRSIGVQAEETILVVPREEVVTRRLELPAAPDEELPELVRFQAAAKSTTPLDQLALDFIPLPPIEGEQALPALVATMDRQRLDHLQKTCAAAGLAVKSVQASPFAVAEVAIRRERQRGDDPNVATLVVYQDEHRVELSILHRLGLVFTHHTRFDPGDERALRGTLAEINRSTVTFNQLMHSTVEVARVCLIHDGAIDPALEQALSERFSGRLHVIDPATDEAVKTNDAATAARLAGLAPAMGALLGDVQRTVPSVDFLNPRKPPPKRDLKRERMIYIGIRAGAAVLFLAVIAWWYASHLQSQIDTLVKEDGVLSVELSGAAAPKNVFSKIQSWQSTAVQPLSELDRLNKLLPGTDRVLLLDVHVLPGRTGELARITGVGIARTERDIEELFDALTTAGYRVQPQVNDDYKLDPDYPHQFDLDISRLPKAEPPAVAKSNT
jgi:Tfp pilus assembly PilM family ATPase